jgi:hypothetical protein
LGLKRFRALANKFGIHIAYRLLLMLPGLPLVVLKRRGLILSFGGKVGDVKGGIKASPFQLRLLK